MEGHGQLVSFIWSVADLLRGDYKQSEYGRVILPLTVLRRLDCVLEATKPAVIEAVRRQGHRPNPDPILRRAAGDLGFYNTSKLDFRRLLDDPQQIAGSLREYVAAFSPGAAETLLKFNFDEQITRLDEADLLYLIVGKFADIDLHPDVVSNQQMGYVFEELIRRFSEQSNETAGHHFTPREVIRLMVDLLFAGDGTQLRTKGIVKTIYDPACGTGGMLSIAEEYLRDLNPDGQLAVFGQELNAESYAICRSDMMLKGQHDQNIAFGNTLSNDQHDRRFDYMLSNPPFGVEWKKIEARVKEERDTLGHAGRFGAGLPRINDGSFLFLQHMISKMKPADEGGSRIAIVFNGSPLFTGAAGSGESEIRRWIIESDWLDAVVALPDQLFYNTGISTYIWLVTNAKADARRGRVQLIDARAQWEKMPKSLGEKRKRIPEAAIAEITHWYEDFEQTETSKVLDNEAFGFRRVTVERPLRLRVDLGGAGERLDELAGKLGEEVVAAIWEAVARLDVPAEATIADATSRITKALPKLSAAKRKFVLSAFLPRDPGGEAVVDSKGRPVPDPDLRDYENVPLERSQQDYLDHEVLPLVSDAWIDRNKTIVGYEIPLTRHFYVRRLPRAVDVIDRELHMVEAEIAALTRTRLTSSSVVAGEHLADRRRHTEVPWLESLPIEWPEAKLSLVARLGTGHTPSRSRPEYWDNCTIPWITTGEVQQIRDDQIEVLWDTREKLSSRGIDHSAAVVHPSGTVVLSRTASAGFSAIMGTSMATSQDFVTWTCGPRLLPRFLLLCLRAMRADLLGRLAMGSTHKTIYFPDIQSIRIPLPTLSEQQRAIDLSDGQRVALEALEAAMQTQLALLRERRQALTTAAVTGRLQTPGTTAANAAP